jgi:predicted dehydrogenase
MVEKPFVPTSQQAAELAAAARTANRLICVYQNRRWDSDFLTFRSLYADGAGELGRIVEFETHFDRYKPERPRTWKGELGMADAGGVVYDLGSHLIDQVYVTFGLPRSVTAIFSNQRADGADEPDSVTILLQYPGGLVCTAKAGVVSIESEQLRFWVRGTGGTYKKYHLDVQEDQLKAGAKPTDANFGVEGEERAGVLTTLVGGTPVARAQPNVKPVTYLGIYERFVEAIRAGDASKVPVKAEEAADVLRIIEAARRSAKEGRTVEL